jgi:hypothetical protein
VARMDRERRVVEQQLYAAGERKIGNAKHDGSVDWRREPAKAVTSDRSRNR